MQISIPKPLFDNMCRGVQCANISEGYITKTFFFQNKEIVITGSRSSKVAGYIEIWGHYVVDIENYKGDLKPLNGNDHWNEVQDGKRERGYKAQKTKYGKRTIVFIGESITFVPLMVDIQLELFNL